MQKETLNKFTRKSFLSSNKSGKGSKRTFKLDKEIRTPQNEDEINHVEKQQRIRAGLFMHDDKSAFIKAAKEHFNTMKV